jgi:hypothetical protein
MGVLLVSAIAVFGMKALKNDLNQVEIIADGGNLKGVSSLSASSEDCIVVSYYCYCSLNFYWKLPDSYNDFAQYQLFSSPGDDKLVGTVRIALLPISEQPDLYTYNSEIQVWDNSGENGLPGTKLGGITVTPEDYVLYPGWTEVDFSDQSISYDDLWIGIESFAPSEETGIRTLSDSGQCGAYRSCENWGGTYGYMLDNWGMDFNFVMEADACRSSGQNPSQICGDSNNDGEINAGDAVYTIAYVFKGGSAPEFICQADANGDGNIDIGDAVRLISYIFRSGAAPEEDCCL